jgi:hypothetical protein
MNNVNYKLLFETLNIVLMNNKDINCVFKKICIKEPLNKNRNNLNAINKNNYEKKHSIDEIMYKKIRKWRQIEAGNIK